MTDLVYRGLKKGVGDQVRSIKGIISRINFANATNSRTYSVKSVSITGIGLKFNNKIMNYNMY